MYVEKLIDIVKQNPILYDKTCALYKDTASRHKTWEQIAKQLDIPADLCKAKWEKLRNCFTNALKRRSKTKNGSPIMPPWKYERQMRFLRQHIILKGSSINNESNEEETFYNYEELDSTYSPPPNLKSINDDEEKYSLQLIEKRIDSQASKRTLPEMDENDLFFLSMSMQIKQFSKSDQARIRFKLHKMVHETQMLKEDSSSEET